MFNIKNFKKIICVILAVITVFSCFAMTASAANIKSVIMKDNNILSYKYSEKDDYWYTDKDHAWQHNFGYSAVYDLAAPFIGMEYDYVRVHFTYDNKDWMVQLWKGQYGPIFYGCEAGVYTKPHSDKEDNTLTFYNCASQDDRLQIQTNLYKYDVKNNETRVFSTPDEKTWWSTGFKPGHLLIEEPASELREAGKIKFDTPEMAEAFAEGLKECGFKQVNSEKDINNDTFCIDGDTVRYSWRYISEAENTMPIKLTGAAILGSSVALTAIASLIVSALLFNMIFMAFI